jgi:hypothetical protein
MNIWIGCARKRSWPNLRYYPDFHLEDNQDNRCHGRDSNVASTSRIKQKLRGFSPQANYTDRAKSAKLVPTLADRGRCVVSGTNPKAVNFGFLDRSRYFSIQIAARPTTSQKIW